MAAAAVGFLAAVAAGLGGAGAPALPVLATAAFLASVLACVGITGAVGLMLATALAAGLGLGMVEADPLALATALAAATSAGLGSATGANFSGVSIMATGVGIDSLISVISALVVGYLSSVSTASHFLAGGPQERSWEMHATRMASNFGVPKISIARFMVAATASASSSRSASGSMAPIWNPVTPSLTVSTSPPVEETSGMVP